MPFPEDIIAYCDKIITTFVKGNLNITKNVYINLLKMVILEYLTFVNFWMPRNLLGLNAALIQMINGKLSYMPVILDVCLKVKQET